MNHLGQRTTITRDGLAHTTPETETVGYDSKGQVVKTDNAANTAFNRLFTFDGIGNRLSDSLNTYSVNNVNEITGVTTAGNTLTTTHDDDGNMLTGTLPEDTTGATLEWDANNRLTKITKSDGTIVEYTYDYQSRRISKTTAGSTTAWIYNGWNPIAKYSGATLKKTYLWGQDISGGMQSAGGVGGLLQENLITNSNGQITSEAHYPLYDGNGNITDYLDSTGAVVAHYQYDAFGNTIVKTGAKADDFAHRFSTKQRDTETGLYYYGYRYYDPVTGRWPSRDPIEEEGGMNLYAFAGNDGVNRWDYLGLEDGKFEGGTTSFSAKDFQNFTLLIPDLYFATQMTGNADGSGNLSGDIPRSIIESINALIGKGTPVEFLVGWGVGRQVNISAKFDNEEFAKNHYWSQHVKKTVTSNNVALVKPQNYEGLDPTPASEEYPGMVWVNNKQLDMNDSPMQVFGAKSKFSKFTLPKKGGVRYEDPLGLTNTGRRARSVIGQHHQAGAKFTWEFKSSLKCKVKDNIVTRGTWHWGFEISFEKDAKNRIAPKIKTTTAPVWK